MGFERQVETRDEFSNVSHPGQVTTSQEPQFP